jgi:hypothetical protein
MEIVIVAFACVLILSHTVVRGIEPRLMELSRALRLKLAQLPQNAPRPICICLIADGRPYCGRPRVQSVDQRDAPWNAASAFANCRRTRPGSDGQQATFNSCKKSRQPYRLTPDVGRSANSRMMRSSASLPAP